MKERTDQRKEYEKKYAKEHFTRRNVKIKNELYEEFRRLTEANGDSMHGVLLDAVRKYVESHRTP